MEQIRSADVLASFPQVDEEKLNAALAAEAAASKPFVLDNACYSSHSSQTLAVRLRKNMIQE